MVKCTNCGQEMIWRKRTIDGKTGKQADLYECKHCDIKLAVQKGK